jgi:2-dehydro-3-deoxygluconokinase
MTDFQVRQDACALGFLALGALVHRLDPGMVPFRKARSFDVYVSDGEYNLVAWPTARLWAIDLGQAT